MALFEPAFIATGRTEGGWTDDPHETYIGIDRYFWPHAKVWYYVDVAKKTLGPIPTEKEERKQWVKKLNILLDTPLVNGLVFEFYRDNFWLKIYNLINSQKIANYIFDKAVNMGASQIHKLLQRALGFIEKDVDGKFGPVTLRSLNSEDNNFYNKLDRVVDAWYAELAKRQPQKAKYLKSWQNR